jgi:hypothetical protein
MHKIYSLILITNSCNTFKDIGWLISQSVKQFPEYSFLNNVIFKEMYFEQNHNGRDVLGML